jgi:hypothetical protein
LSKSARSAVIVIFTPFMDEGAQYLQNSPRRLQKKSALLINARTSRALAIPVTSHT